MTYELSFGLFLGLGMVAYVLIVYFDTRDRQWQMIAWYALFLLALLASLARSAANDL